MKYLKQTFHKFEIFDTIIHKFDIFDTIIHKFENVNKTIQQIQLTISGWTTYNFVCADDYWLDNLFCFGNEKNLSSCKHDGWGHHDCQRDEGAGVVCMTHFTTEAPTTPLPIVPVKDEPAPVKRQRLQVGKAMLS